MDTTNAPNKPLATYKDSKLKATLWANQNRDGDTYFSINLAKVYQDRNGNWQETNSFSETDILRINELAKEARSHALHLRREQALERQNDRSQDQERSDNRGETPRRFQDRSELHMGR